MPWNLNTFWKLRKRYCHVENRLIHGLLMLIFFHWVSNLPLCGQRKTDLSFYFPYYPFHLVGFFFHHATNKFTLLTLTIHSGIDQSKAKKSTTFTNLQRLVWGSWTRNWKERERESWWATNLEFILFEKCKTPLFTPQTLYLTEEAFPSSIYLLLLLLVELNNN